MFDALIMLRNPSPAADLTPLNDEAVGTTVIDMGGPDLVNRFYQLHVPAIGAAVDTLDVILYSSPSGLPGSWVALYTFPQITGAGAVGEYFCEVKSPNRFISYSSAVSAGSNFGNVLFGTVPAGRHDQP